MPRDDAIRLRDIVEYAELTAQLLAGQSRADLDTDRKLALALVRALEVIGEAAANVSQETRDKHPGVPWRSIVAMRNRLIHAYSAIDLDFVWETAAREVPALLATLRPAKLG